MLFCLVVILKILLEIVWWYFIVDLGLGVLWYLLFCLWYFLKNFML